MKIGVSLKIDVTKIDKMRLYHSQNTGAKFLDATVFIDIDNPDDFGQHGPITQNVTKEERQQKVKGPILGNCKVFWRDDGQKSEQNPAKQTLPKQVMQAAPFDDDIPF
jgi:hypothetical protein